MDLMDLACLGRWQRRQLRREILKDLWGALGSLGELGGADLEFGKRLRWLMSSSRVFSLGASQAACLGVSGLFVWDFVLRDATDIPA